MDNPGTTAAEEPVPTGTDSDFSNNGCLEGHPKEPCFVVAFGASAGGQEPLEHIFTTLPADCNLSYVVIMHFPPDGPALLADHLRRYTPMKVLTAEDGMSLLPNVAYVIPPGTEMTVSSGKLHVARQPGRTAGMHHPIDRFFTSLATDFGKHAVAVVLSGFGTDGAEGVKRIKEKGGTVLAQKPETAINPPMPANVIATDAADLVLTMEDIAGKAGRNCQGKMQNPEAGMSDHKSG